MNYTLRRLYAAPLPLRKLTLPVDRSSIGVRAGNDWIWRRQCQRRNEWRNIETNELSDLSMDSL